MTIPAASKRASGRVRRLAKVLTGAAAVLASSAASPAHAHGFGLRYDLPVPLWLYLAGAAAAVAFTFVAIGLFVRETPRADRYPRLDLLANPLGRLLAHGAVLVFFKLAAVGLFLLVVLAGLFGNQDPLRNIAPTLVWIVWWVGLAYVSVFLGNLWALINPWRTLFGWAEALYRRLRPGRELAFRLAYPDALGVWPALVLLFAFSWIELIDQHSAEPAHIARLALAYSLVTFAGMMLFGREVWLKRGEAFSLVFGIFARFGPTELRVRQSALCASCALDCRDRDGACIDCLECFRRAAPSERSWLLRPFGIGLLRNEPVSTSMTAFVLALLSTVLFDGLLTTPEWARAERALAGLFPAAGAGVELSIRTAGLLAFWLVFIGSYLVVCRIMKEVAGRRFSTGAWARSLAFSLVPIAIAYHFAHYLSFLLVQGQYIVPLASDPFGRGWDLLGTAGYRVDIAVVGARFAWFTAVVAIVIGHIAAVSLAHVKATRMLGARGLAQWSQVPMTALMVLYTVVSLSILAEPIVERRPAAAPAAESAASALVSVPADALLPEAGSGRLRAVGPGKLARLKLVYRMLGSPFHDGSKTTVADIFYPYVFAYRWGTPKDANAADYDPYVDAASAEMRERLVGVRLAGIDATSRSFRIGDLNFVRELFAVEVYADLEPEDPEQDAALAPPWSTLPWPLIALMEEAVTRGWAAFSKAEAERRGVPWLDLVRDPALLKRLAALVEQFAAEGYRPVALETMVNAEDARARWSALGDFYKKRGHFLATNGPYVLGASTADGVTLEVFRDLGYPLGVGSYDAYAIPRRAYITKIEPREGDYRLTVELESIVKFQRSYKIVRQPLTAIPPEVARRAALVCRYFVVAEDGRVARAGLGVLGEDASFHVRLEDKLPAGRYSLFAAVYPNGNAANAEIGQLTIVIPGGP